MIDATKFFLGANSKDNFISYFDQLQEQSESMQLLILKGGPGSGKSSFMKRVMQHAKSIGHEIVAIPCASDPFSLDAFIDITAHFAVMDGTSPHVEDPKLPGALHHIINMGDLWDCSKLNRNKRDISTLNKRILSYHKGAGAYIKAAGALLWENLCYSSAYIDKKRAHEFIRETVSLLPYDNCTETEALLSAVSVGEIKYFDDTVLKLADKIYVIEDEWGGASSYILDSIRSASRMRGTGIVHCPCSINPSKTDHIIIPAIRTAFCVDNRFLKSSCQNSQVIDGLYHDFDDVNLMEKRLSDSQKLLSSSCSLIKKAKKLHDKLETFYVEAMDFSGMDDFYQNTIEKFYKTESL